MEPWNGSKILARAVNSICSPFEKEGEFSVELSLPDNREWLNGLMTAPQIMEYALFKAHCHLSADTLSYSYEFVPYQVMRKVAGREYSYEGPIPKKIHPEVIKTWYW